MNLYKFSLIALAALSLAACAPKKAVINGTLSQAPDTQIIVKQLNVNTYTVLDTISTNSDCRFKYEVQIAAGQPEFIYLFKGDKRVAGLLLEKGEKVEVVTDTLGNYSVSGSASSSKLAEVDKAYTKFMNDLYVARDDNKKMAKIYLDHYRASVKYVMENSHSLTVIPVLYETMSEVSPVFSQNTDALIFKSASDSLKTIYPESRYVKALAKEAERRMNLLNLESQIRNATPTSFPDIVLPDINGEKKALSSLDSKAIILHFWDASNAAQKMMNIETLMPLYEKYHAKGLEIYSVCVGIDKALWGSVVSSQKLPWINVCDGLGAASRAVLTYNVETSPMSLLIADGEICTKELATEADLRKEIEKALR